ncbi:Rieske 2Fe-2S domain-containing protein [Promethearchaeum syntrophicum]|uniref:Rieske 2Fe-2S domain-containing protein n=1 Tax=Promethearchaeum syntrophicum TaxID=2594042 RepID=A0A5B9D9R6_9ARCH|nr:aromatic ring-hydroxylating dioxygenase subunit alpha [Candidatus Prometheoarchaeum syntrophicum]QEE15842.1 Rieske (2Fe-2S) domain protein [Candidatus Prometheoarchaeum syntrophicum]
MIRNQWYAILDCKEVRKKNKPISVLRLGEKLVLWRDNKNQIHCLFDKCSHRGAALSLGKIINDNIQCPFHGLEYDSTGKCKLIPANSIKAVVPDRFQVKNYIVREKHGFIWIWWGEPREEYPPIPWFDDLSDDFHYYTIRDQWKTHYSRVIENQLDVVHLPYVHHNTIGRGGRTVVEGPIVEIADDLETVWFMNRKENGKLPKKITDLEKPPYPPMLYFKFPHIWQNKLSKDGRIFVAFTPVDEANTLVYARFYQRFLKFPILKQIASFFGKLGSIIILHQDRRVVETQSPKSSSWKSDENLIQGDRPIVYYRRKRHELKNTKNKSEI